MELLARAPEGSPDATTTAATKDGDSLFARGIADLPGLLRWLGARSFLYKSRTADDDREEEGEKEDEEEEWQESIVTDVTPTTLLLPACHPLLGFNGRCNKHADTCYTWWTVASMAILARHGLVDDVYQEAAANWGPSRRFLLEQTQHAIGGFAKSPGGPPDVYHSFLGLAALATRGEPSLKAFDPAMTATLDTVRTIEAARRGLLRGLGDGGAARRDALLSLGKACWRPQSSSKAIPV